MTKGIVIQLLLASSLATFNSGCKNGNPTKLTELARAKVSSKMVSSGYSTVIEGSSSKREVLVLVRQRGMDVRVIIKDSSGVVISLNDVHQQVRLTESVLFSAAENESYSISLQPVIAARGGIAELTVYSLREGNTADRTRIEAEQLVSDATKAESTWDPDYWRPMATKLQRASKLFAKIGLREREAETNYILSFVTYMYLTEWDAAAEIARNVEQYYQKSKQPLLQAAALNLIAMSLIEVPLNSNAKVMARRYEEADTLFRQCIGLLGLPTANADLAWVVNNKAIGYLYSGMSQEAIAGFKEAEKLAFESRSMPYYRVAKRNRMLVEDNGNYQESIVELESFIKEIDISADPTTYGLTSLLLGQRYLDHGFWTKSITAYSNARESLTLPSDILKVKVGLSRALLESGSLSRSKAYMDDVDISNLESNESSTVYQVLQLKVDLARKDGDLASAHKILNQFQSRVTSRNNLAYLDTIRARVYLAQTNFESAKISSARSLKQMDAEQDRLRHIDSLLVAAEAVIGSREDLLQARQFLAKAESSLKNYFQPLVEARLEYLLAKLSALFNNYKEALDHSSAAVNLVAQQRFASGNVEYRNGLLEKQSDIFVQHADILFELYRNAVDEQQRSDFLSRFLYFTDATKTPLKTVDSGQVENFERDTALQHQRNRISYLAQLLAGYRKQVNLDFDEVQLAFEQALLEYDVLQQQRLRLTQPRINKESLEQIQTRLDGDAAIVSLWLRGNSPVLWLIQRSKITPLELDNIDEINRLAMSLHLQSSTFGKRFIDLQTKLRSKLKLSELVGLKKIYFVPDGSLQLAPPALLFEDDVAVRVLPSISSLIGQSVKPVASRNNAILFGNPSYVAPQLRNLPGSSIEIESISEMLKGYSVEVFEMEKATRAAFLEKVRDQSIIHIAAHGHFDPSQPLASGIIFSDQNHTKRGYANNFLTVNDIRGLSLDKSPLVVLSACLTAFGRDPGLEGYVGFPNAFLSSGASSVLVSLWDVPDKSTAELMTEFYRNYSQHSMHPADALRKAQYKVRENPRLRHPINWAGWTLVSRQ